MTAAPPPPSPTAGEMRRLRVDLGYDGSEFSGWAAQPGLRTVEGELAAALGRVLRVDPPRLVVAGRTDAGVHARGQVVHVDVPTAAYAACPGRSDRPPAVALRRRLDAVLPPDVRVHAVREVGAEFDARFAALRRRYLYRLADDAAVHDPLRRHDTVDVDGLLDVAAMTAAGERLVGLRDFAAYCKRRDGASTVRTLLALRWERLDDGVVAGTVVADAFCHSMVRALVGAAVPVGLGQRPVEWPLAVLGAGVRDPAVKVMPARGLSLEEVTYPDAGEWAQRAQAARNRRDPLT